MQLIFLLALSLVSAPTYAQVTINIALPTTTVINYQSQTRQLSQAGVVQSTQIIFIPVANDPVFKDTLVFPKVK